MFSRVTLSLILLTLPLTAIQAKEKKLPQWLKINGRIRVDAAFKESKDFQDDLKLKDFDLNVTGQLAEHIKLVTRMRMALLLRENGQEADEKWKQGEFDWEEFFYNAYVSIKNINGRSVAFVHWNELKVGKHEIAFGQDFTRTPVHNARPIHGLAEQSQLLGITIALDASFFKIIDKIEVSGFNTEKIAFALDSFDGWSIRASKKITDEVKAELSYLHKGNGYQEGLHDENRASLGFVYNDGSLKVWVEGLGLIDDNKYPDSNFAGSFGVAHNLGNGEISTEISYIEDEFSEYTVGYRWFLTKRFWIGPEVSYRINEGDLKDDEWMIGVRAQYVFGNEKKYNKNPLFGAEGSASILKTVAQGDPISLNKNRAWSAVRIDDDAIYNFEVNRFAVDTLKLPIKEERLMAAIFPDVVRQLAWAVILEKEAEKSGLNVKEEDFLKAIEEGKLYDKDLRNDLREIWRLEFLDKVFVHLLTKRLHKNPDEIERSEVLKLKKELINEHFVQIWLNPDEPELTEEETSAFLLAGI